MNKKELTERIVMLFKGNEQGQRFTLVVLRNLSVSQQNPYKIVSEVRVKKIISMAERKKAIINLCVQDISNKIHFYTTKEIIGIR